MDRRVVRAQVRVSSNHAEVLKVALLEVQVEPDLRRLAYRGESSDISDLDVVNHHTGVGTASDRSRVLFDLPVRY